MDFADTHNYSLSGKTAPHKATIALTQAMIDNITAGNYLIVKGAGYTAEKITLTHTPAEAGTTQSIWSGSVVMPDNWGAWQTINASKFANAVEGQLLRCRFTDLSTNAQLQLKQTGDWSELVDAPLAPISGRYYDYTITAAMLVELKANGVIVSGCNYTLTEVLLINPADLKPLTLAVPVTDDWESKYFLRMKAVDAPGVLAEVTGLLAREKISVSSMMQKDATPDGKATLIMITHSAPESAIRRVVQALNPEICKVENVIRVEE